MLKAALYCRLSRDDGDTIESSSIASQKKFLAEYAMKNQYVVHDYYIDDGFSGTDFERPDFKRMIRDVEKGSIQVIIVKDLSRFGRNYLKTGFYLEEYFPQKNIKFIAINDNYDSAKDDNEFAPFKNI
ncbi:MAG TPA: recombinase family protein, partial [Candidatus Pelethenecus sp.]|nr:recombinase family protein [Candidatus Pelethenecus sp.]